MNKILLFSLARVIFRFMPFNGLVNSRYKMIGELAKTTDTDLIDVFKRVIKYIEGRIYNNSIEVGVRKSFIDRSDNRHIECDFCRTHFTYEGLFVYYKNPFEHNKFKRHNDKNMIVLCGACNRGYEAQKEIGRARKIVK